MNGRILTLSILLIFALSLGARPEDARSISNELPSPYEGIYYFLAQGEEPENIDESDWNLAGENEEPEAAGGKSEEIPEFDLEIPEVTDITLEVPEEPETGVIGGEGLGTISVDFPEEEIRTVIRNVADLYELNVVIPDTLMGSTSIKLRNVTWRQVFDVVLEPVGYTYIEDRNIVKIKSLEELQTEAVDTRVFIINFADAGELQGSVSPLIDKAAGGSVQVDSRSNALIITERPSHMNKIQETIERLDRPTAQVMIESKFIEINATDGKDLGIKWDTLEGHNFQIEKPQRQYTGHSAGLKEVEREDEYADSEQTDFVNESKPSEGSLASTLTNTILTKSAVDLVMNLTRIQGDEKFDTAVFSSETFGLLLSALESTDKASVLTNPTVVTLNNKLASINIGEERPIPKYQYNEERGSFEISDFEFKPIGTILKVTPQVNSAGFITLKLEPEISSSDRAVKFGGAAGTEIPIIDTTKTKSVVTIKDGYTLAIGGLIKTNKGDSVTKIPLLGDIPFFGQLFKHKSKSTRRSNMVIFITAKTLNPDGSTYQEVFSPAQLYEMGVDERQIPGYEYSDEEMNLYSEVRAEKEASLTRRQVALLRAQLEKFQQKERKEEEKQEQPPQPATRSRR